MIQDVDPIFRARNISKYFDEFHLENINLDLYPGEVHVLVGENGVGKSTLMKMIGGWFPPESGYLEYYGEGRVFSSIHAARKAGVIYIHQDLMNFENLSVGENLYFNQGSDVVGSKLYYNCEMINARSQQLLDEMGVNIDPRTPLGRLGFAERQLVAVLRAYISTARIIIFDEPSSAMTEPDRNILFEIVRRLVERGTGIFYISHRMDEIQMVGSRVSVLSNGEITETRECRHISQTEVVKMMTGKVHRERYPRINGQPGPEVMSVRNLQLLPILKSVSFSLSRGEILGITGLMGSGRTLLAHCLFGNARPDDGEVIINGIKVDLDHPRDAMAAGISLIPEDRVDNGIFPKHDLVRNMTTATLKRFLQNYALDDRFMNELTHQYSDRLSITPGLSRDILETYSGGNQQKVLVGRWLMNRSLIYIMDEPTRGIDAASKIDIYNTMNDIVDKNAAIILISSEIDEILGMSDRILVLAGGRIICDLNRKEATKELILQYATSEE